MTRNALLLAAITIPATASLSLAQYRIDNGQARDANNRIGSGGFNAAGQLSGRINGLAGNYIVTGNVTGGRAFRGSLGYTDPNAFRGTLGSGSFDNFLRDSIGASQMRGTTMGVNNFATIQPFYGAATVSAPQGFARDPNTGTFYLPRTTPGVTAGDGRIDYGGASRADVTAGVLSTQRATGGAGLTTTPFANLSQREQLSNLTRMSDFTAIARPGAVVPGRSSLADVVSAGPRLPQLPTQPQTETDPSESADEKETEAASPGLTGQGTVYRNLRALDNNSQYAELRKRLEKQASLPKLPNSEATDSLNKINADILAQREKEKAAAKPADSKVPGGPQMPIVPGAGERPAGDAQKRDDLPAAPQDTLNLPRPAQEPAIAAPASPLEITSLATGVKDADLSKLLTDAEAAMKQGKFSTAIEAYSQAEEMATDDPLVFMGRAIAELGGGYYRSAELHFRQAFAADRALLLAKFDLRGMLTDDRLNTLQNDLATIARKNEKDTGPLLLLAFIYYNSGFPERSERALEMVQERAGGNDADAKLLKEAWFPAAEVAPSPTENK